MRLIILEMKKALIAGLVSIGLLASVHFGERYFETRKVEDIPAKVSEINNMQARASRYLTDNNITEKEHEKLYWICRDAHDSRMLSDSQGLTTEAGRRIQWKLFNLRYRDSFDYAKLNSFLADYQAYLGSAEHYELIHPLSIRERAKRNLVAFLAD